MATHWEVRQLVRSVTSNRLEVVSRRDFQRMAESDYWHYTLAHPGEYFELVRVEHCEECLAHNGKPDVSPNTPS